MVDFMRSQDIDIVLVLKGLKTSKRCEDTKGLYDVDVDSFGGGEAKQEIFVRAVAIFIVSH